MRTIVQERRYVLTTHADSEMDADGLSIYDVETAILTGEIVERQGDRETLEWKYVLSGRSVTEDPMGVVLKLSPTDKLVIITVYLE